MSKKVLMVALALALVLLGLTGCTGWLFSPPSEEILRQYPVERALRMLLASHPNGAAVAQALDLDPTQVMGFPIPQLRESLALIRQPEARGAGAHAEGQVGLILDWFTKFPDHGDLVAAVLWATAPELELYYCDIPKNGVPDCLNAALERLNHGEPLHFINMSFTYLNVLRFYFGETESFTTQTAEVKEVERLLAQLYQRGVMLVAAAGNNNLHNATGFPAYLNFVLSAGAVYDKDFSYVSFSVCSQWDAKMDTPACFSNWGEIFAPGWRQEIELPDGETVTFGGTSAASPFTAASLVTVIATCKETLTEQPPICPSIYANSRLLSRADPITPWPGVEYLEHKRVNLYNAISDCVALPPPPPTLYKWVDEDGNCRISDREILRAVRYWVTGDRWDGDSITDREILDLVRLWIMDDLIC